MRYLAAILFTLLLIGNAFPQSNIVLTGRVVTNDGSPVAHAEVLLINGSITLHSIADRGGIFTIRDVPFARGSLMAKASGFAERKMEWKPGEDDIHIVLQRTPDETINVFGDRFANDSSRTTQSLDAQDLLSSGAVLLDDALRQAAGFQLFRRSGSRTANPTSQGVSLRGVGSTGASRALVLYDGAPINDPFGGWVYWGLIPKEAIESADIFAGGGSDLYGNSALGGVVNFQPKHEAKSSLSLSTSGGNQGTERIFVKGSLQRSDVNVAVQAESFSTSGYFLLNETDRGTVDRAASSDHRSIELVMERSPQLGNRQFFRTGYYAESRNNGTALQINQTVLRNFNAGVDQLWDKDRTLSIRFFGAFEDFDQQFSIIDSARNEETIASAQHVPSRRLGFALHYSYSPWKWNNVMVGGDAQHISGQSQEISYLSGNRTAPGGIQNSAALFLRDQIRLNDSTTIQLENRYDAWKNEDRFSGAMHSQAWSPRVSLIHQTKQWMQLRGAFYNAFRAPTLNELYRPFRLGSILTLNNPNLRAERLKGIEAGVHIKFGTMFETDATIFRMNIAEAVGNITLSSSADLIRRERDNFGNLRSAGVQWNAHLRPTTILDLRFGYQYANATVISSPRNPLLQGLAIPQVPRHQFTFAMDYRISYRWTLSFQGRSASTQFDDDLNRLPLDPFFTLDAMLAYRIRPSWVLFASAENLLNDRYEIGRVPYMTLGSPRLVQAGLRFNLF